MNEKYPTHLISFFDSLLLYNSLKTQRADPLYLLDRFLPILFLLGYSSWVVAQPRNGELIVLACHLTYT